MEISINPTNIIDMKIFYILLLAILSLTVSCEKEEETIIDEVSDVYTGLKALSDDDYLNIPYSEIPFGASSSLPDRYDLSNDMPHVDDQGPLNSCVAWAIGYYLKSYQEKIEHGYPYSGLQTVMSPPYLYNQRANDDGMFLKEGLEMLISQGICTLSEMPLNGLDSSTQPNNYQRQQALKNRIASYERLDGSSSNIVNEVKYYITQKSPIVIGLKVDDEFQNKKNINYEYTYYGLINPSIFPDLHAMLIVGYDDSKNAFKAINSWGEQWANNGYCWIDYGLLTDGNDHWFTRSTVFRAYRAIDIIEEPLESNIVISGDLDFGDILVGNTSPQESFTVSNTGDEAFNITGFNIPEGFELINGQSTIVTLSSPKTFYVTFHPTQTQSYTGFIEVINTADNANSSNSIVNVSGSGIENGSSNISLSGDLDFGVVSVGESISKTLTISNTGNQSFNVSNISLPFNEYNVNWSSGSISANSSQDVIVTFTPTNSQTYNGNIYVSSDADNGNNTISINGTGENTVSSTISLSGNLDFGDVTLGENSTLNFTISNTGNQSFYVSEILMPNVVYYTNWNSGTVPAYGSQSVTVTFEPTNAQSYNGTINVISGAYTGNGNINVYGNGVANTNNEITPTNNCATAPLMIINTEYEVNDFETQYLDLAYPIENESYQNGLVRGFYLSFTVPTNDVYRIKIYDVSNDFDPVIGVKVDCNTGYYNDIYDQQPYKNNNGYGGNEYFYGQFAPGYTYTMRIYHYYGDETPDVGFKVKITPY